MPADDRETRVKDGVDWRIGTDAEVSWIRTPAGGAFASAVPLGFDAYATLVFPDLDFGPRDVLVPEHDGALLAVLERHTAAQPWWLGYLDTGASDVVFYDAPKVRLYWGWRYVLVQAGPEQAARWRPNGDWANWKETELPELIFPSDRAWLVSTMWDDDWMCIGASEGLIADLLADPLLGPRTRATTPR
jgi:hypothetical protein